jgi:1-acyl-sn-glycerol-3-phosphate acyltransferase
MVGRTTRAGAIVNDATAAEQLRAIVQQLACETHPGHAYAVSAHTSFEHELGLDSLARVELMQRVGKHFGVELPAEALAEADTPRELLRFLGPAPQARAGQAPAPLPEATSSGLPGAAQTLLDVLEWHVAQQPDRVHILLHDERHQEHPISYRELLDAAHSVAAGLAAHGLQPGQTVALMLPTGMDYLASFFAVMIAGGIPVPIYPPARMAGIEDHLRRHVGILSNAQAALIVTVAAAKAVAVMLQAKLPGLMAIVTPSELRALAAPGVAPPVRSRPQAGELAFLQYTSGSTGAPKGVALTHANVLANVRALGAAAQAGPGDRFVSWLPLYHDMGLIGAWFGSLYFGMPLTLMSPLAFLARPALWLETIARQRGTISAAPNFAYELCLRHVSDAMLAGLDLSSWRLALNGAEPVSPATLTAFAERFARCGLRREALTPVYGLAESSVGLAFPPLGRGPRIDLILREPFSRDRSAVPAPPGAANPLAIACCGLPLPGHQLRIVDETGVELAERRIGRLEFCGPSATSGYYRNPEATRALVHDGWLDSGDDAYMAQGELYITGRVKDLIKRGGRNLYPYDLEEAIGKVPGIRKGCVAVFGSPDPATGSERLVVVAETREQADAARGQLRRTVNDIAIDVIGLPPDDVVLVPPHSVLKTSSGKIRRLASRQAYEQGTLAQAITRPWLHKARFAASALLARARVGARRLAAWAYGGYAWAAFGALLLPFAALVIVLRQPAAGRRNGRCGARLLFRLAGVRPVSIGIERLPRQPHVLLVNHASYLDAIALCALLPATPGYALTAKREFARQPAMRGLLNGLGALFVERDDARRSSEDVALMAAALRRGENVLVFPEGTFSREAGIRPFHSGALSAAAMAAAPVVVAGLRGTRAALRDGSWWPRRTSIALEIGPVLAPPGLGWSETVRLRDAARSAMAALSGEFAIPG